MNSKERVLRAVQHQAPVDRTPITFDAEKEVFEALYDHFGDRSRENLFDRLGCDTWMVLPTNYINFAEDAGKTEKTTIWGWKSVVMKYVGGTYEELCFSPLAGKDDLSDIDRYSWPDPDVQDFSHFASEIAAHKDRAIIAASSYGSYFIASFLRGMEGILIDFASNERYAERLISVISERVIAFLQNMLDRAGDGIDIVYMADDYCGQHGPLFGPAAFKRFVVPYLSRVVDLAHRHGKKFLLHVCGGVRPLLPMIIDCGVDMLEPIQVRARGMDPVGLKRDFGKHLCFYGGLDLQEVLRCGTPEPVREETRFLIDTLGQDGGYVFGPGHTYIQVDAPIENIIAMYETAQTWPRITRM
ncbi:MAG: uroporphyrinogen decarboxylase family protein [Acidobacteriota bacterium]